MTFDIDQSTVIPNTGSYGLSPPGSMTDVNQTHLEDGRSLCVFMCIVHIL